MKSTASTRALTNGTSTHTARSAMASPLAATASMARMVESGKKSRRSSLDKPPAAVAAPHSDGGFQYRSDGVVGVASQQDLLLQLQQLQHQQQLHHQHGQAGATVAFGYPGAASMQPVAAGYLSYMAQPPSVLQHMPQGMVATQPLHDSTSRQFQAAHASAHSGTTSSPGVAGEAGEDLMGRIEKKDQMIAQLGTFLSQMKQESEGTANAWKEKMQEIAELKRQVAALAQHLKDSQEQEKRTAEQLSRVTEDVELAVHGLKESEAKHLEELKIMNDEIQRRQLAEDQARTEYEEILRQLKDQLVECTGRLDDQTRQRDMVEDAMQKMDTGHRITVDTLEEQLRECAYQLEQVRGQHQAVEKEKQELAQHLWNVTQALDQATNRQQSLQIQLDEVSRMMDQNRTSWSVKDQEMQAEKMELINTCSSIQSQLKASEEQVQQERSQKEQINALMGEEMERVGKEMHGLHQQYGAKLDQHQVEIEHWKSEATTLQEKLIRVEGQYVLTRKELDEWEARASQIDAEIQLLQKTGTEKAYTLQEINEQLRQTLTELHESRQRSDQLRLRCESLEAGVTQCIHHLPDRMTDEVNAIESFPTNVIKILEQWKHQASHLEQIQVAMLRLQQDRDNEREKTRTREQELVHKALNLQSEMESAKADATVLAQELQEVAQRVSGNEAQLTARVQQLTKELDDSRSDCALQILQLQKALDSQKSRAQQLEDEKRDLLQEAESMNASVESLYRAKNEKQVEFDQLRASWKELQAEHADLKESVEDIESNYERTTVELNQRVKELQQLVQDLTAAKGQLVKENGSFNDALAKIQIDYEAMHRQYSSDQIKWSEQEREIRQAVDEKSHRLEEMLDMLTQVRSRNEFLEQARATDDQNVRSEFDKFQQQLLTLTQDKKRTEMAYANAKAQLDQLMPELFTLKEEKRHYSQAHGELEDGISNLKAEIIRLQGELERSSRARSSLQLELSRVTDEAQDVVRQFEVLRRGSKASEKHYQDEIERSRKEMEDLRNEGTESAAMVEELQAKMTSVQNAANATINELMVELQNAQDTMGYDKNRFHKENEALKAHVRAVEDELRKKDADVKEIQGAFRQEKEYFAEKENELTTKLARVSSVFEAKKQDADRLAKEVETKGLKVAEYERKMNPLIHARDNLQTKCNELKAALEAKIRDVHDVEERYRDEAARAVKEKRDIEAMFVAMKEDYDLMKSQSNGQQQQWQSDFRAMKHNLERTKADLMKANADVLALTQRLESCQQSAQDTIADFSSRLQGVDQQKEFAITALQREINLERERRREAEVQKMELQRSLRQRNVAQLNSSPASSGAVASGYPEEGVAWGLTMPTPSSQRHQPLIHPAQSAPVRGASAPETISEPHAEPLKQIQASTPTEYRKFYANEPMTNAELANLPMNLIKAQIGLDMAGHSLSKSPAKTVKNATRTSTKVLPGDNNDAIPLLSFDKLPQNPEAHDGDNSPTCDSMRLLSEKRSGVVSLLESPSARSNSDRYLTEAMDNALRPQRNLSSSSISSSGASSVSNNKKKQPSAKKKRPSVMPSSSSATAAAYGSFTPLPAPTPSPPKMKSNSKLLPRIQQ